MVRVRVSLPLAARLPVIRRADDQYGLVVGREGELGRVGLVRVRVRVRVRIRVTQLER